MKDAQQDPCAHCEEMMQPYLDHILTEAERAEAEHHLDDCEWCRRRYRFEESLRVRQATAAAERERDEQERAEAATPARRYYGSPPCSTVCSTSAHFFPHGLNLFAVNPSRHVCIASSRWPLNQYARPSS